MKFSKMKLNYREIGTGLGQGIITKKHFGLINAFINEFLKH